MLNKMCAFRGYRNPRSFSESDIDRSIDYSFRTVEHWLRYLQDYINSDCPFEGKVVLELGPGLDIGVDSILLERLACEYYAFDSNNLFKYTAEEFYSSILERLENRISKNEVMTWPN